MTILKKSQFKTDATGRLVVKGHIQPVTLEGAASKVEDGIKEITSSNEAVGTVEKDPENKDGFIAVWVGAGNTQVRATGDADLDAGETRDVSGVLDLKFEEDEADQLQLILDGIEPVPEPV